MDRKKKGQTFSTRLSTTDLRKQSFNERKQKPAKEKISDVDKDECVVLNPDFSCEEYRSGVLLSDLVHSVGHEIGNPLTSIISLASIVNRIASEQLPSLLDESNPSMGLPKKISDYSNAILKEAWRLSAISQDLVVLLSKKQNKGSFSNLDEVLQHAIRRLRKLVPQEYFEIQIQFDPACRSVAIDGEQLRIVMSELLKRAFLLCASALPSSTEEPPNGVNNLPYKAKVTVDDRMEFVNVYINVEHPHITENDHRRIDSFRPITATSRDGLRLTGLDLGAAWAVLERHGGTLCIKTTTNPDKDFTSFIIGLPGADLATEESLLLGEQGNRRFRLLVIGSDSIVVDSIQRILTMSLGNKVELECVASTWQQANTIIREQSNFGAIVCDLSHDVGDSQSELLDLLENNPRLLGRLGFLASHAEIENLPRRIKELHRPSLIKPFEFDELCAFVVQLVR